MRYLVQSALVITVLLGISACTHNAPLMPVVTTTTATNSNNNTTTTTTTNNNTPKYDSGPDSLIDSSVCFQRDILPIFVKNCAVSGCHNAPYGTHGFVLDNYADIMSRGIEAGYADGSDIFRVINGSNPSMPQSPYPKLDTQQQHLIEEWINAGARNDTTCH